jgi:predicted DNA-binding transcriptional regulator AlpA
MREIEPLLGVEDVMRIFGLSRVSIYRKVAAARAGESRFPAPIGDAKQRLRWLGTDIEEYIKTRSTVQPSAHIISPAKQAKKQRERLEVTRATLEKHGIFNTNNR